MDNTVCCDGNDAFHILKCQPIPDYSKPECLVRCPKPPYRLFHVVFGNLPHLASHIRGAVVDGLHHKHTAEDVAHSAISDNRVASDSADAYNFQPGAVTVKKMDNIHV